MLIRVAPHEPRVHPEAFIAPSADLVGNVVIEAGSSVWFNAILRAEHDPITVGPESNIQDGCCVHTDPGVPVRIGRGVTVGHGAILHGCEIADGALIGMGAIVLNGARVGERALVGSGAVVAEGKIVPPRTLYLGVPGRVIRELSDADLARLEESAQHYVTLGRRYRSSLHDSVR